MPIAVVPRDLVYHFRDAGTKGNRAIPAQLDGTVEDNPLSLHLARFLYYQGEEEPFLIREL
jgi:hypothetical protein